MGEIKDSCLLVSVGSSFVCLFVMIAMMEWLGSETKDYMEKQNTRMTMYWAVITENPDCELAYQN